jgi:hypothetical protein
MVGELAPTTRLLKERAEYYRRRAAKEPDPAKAAGYRERARVLDEAAEPQGRMPAEQAEIDRRKHDIREGEKRVARQLELVKRLDAEGREGESRQAREFLAVLTEPVDAFKRSLQVTEKAQRR